MAPAVAERPAKAVTCECGSAMLEGKCVDPNCEVAAEQSLPSGALIDSTAIGAPNAFTIRGGVD
jgi:hypothetical protein